MFCCLFGLSFTTIAIFTSALIAIYFYLTRNFNYWSSRGIKGPKPVVLVGNFLDLFYKPFHEIEEERVKKYGTIYGIYFGSKPMLSVSEPELVKNIMVKDFHNFVNRQVIDIGDPVLERALTIVKDDEWKQLRSIVSPTFSSSKMRKMHHFVEQCVQSVDKVLEKAVNEKKDVELKTLMGNYTMDVIATCAFATKIDTHNDPNNPFILNAIKIFKGNMIRAITFFAFRPLMKLLNISVIDPNVMDFFKSAITEIMRQRNESKEKHHDFLQLMMNANKKISDEELEDKSLDLESHHGHEENVELVSKSKIEVTDTDILATSFVFFLAGYETTANLLSNLIYSLALYPQCQQKLLKEVLDNRDESGSTDYDIMARMPYLDACISETLRLYNPAIQTLRTASQDYTLGDTGIVVPKGMVIQIPIHGIHHNENFYPNPHRFSPDRFLPENRDKLIPYTYLPFGAGPRNCVGMRFALMEAKTIIVNIIPKYEFVRTDNTKVPLQYRKLVGLMQAIDITVGVRFRQ